MQPLGRTEEIIIKTNLRLYRVFKKELYIFESLHLFRGHMQWFEMP
jgi:hypothetical protein